MDREISDSRHINGPRNLRQEPDKGTEKSLTVHRQMDQEIVHSAQINGPRNL